jgi:hypothetical protein
MLLALLTIGDIALLAYLRRRRWRRAKADRMMGSLRLAIRLDLASLPAKLRLMRAPAKRNSAADYLTRPCCNR